MKRKRQESPDLSPITLAQASEIYRLAPDATIITDWTEQGPIQTIWGREDERTISIETYERFVGKPPAIVRYADLHFNNNGNVESYTGSYISPHRGLRKALSKLRRHEQQEMKRGVQETVRFLVEKVFKDLEEMEDSSL